MISSDRCQNNTAGGQRGPAPIGRRMTDRQARIHRRASYARKPMIGIDIGKNSFHVVGHDGPAPAPKPSATAFCEPSASCSRHHPRRFGDRLGITEVILLSLGIGANILRQHQPGIVAQCPKFATEMMRTDAGFHPNQARWHVGKACLDLATRPLLPQHDSTTLIVADNWNEFFPISMPITEIALSNFWDMACSLC